MEKHLLLRMTHFCIWMSAYTLILVKRRIFLMAIVSLSVIILIMLLKWGLVCTSVQPWLHIRDICSIYANGQILGSLCSSLCLQGDVSSISCHNFYMGKEAVFSGIWQNANIVFKSPKMDENTKLLQDKHYPTETEFIEMIKSNVKTKFNISISDIDAHKLSYIEHELNKNVHLRHTEMNNVWSLMQDNEYMALILYRKFDVFPKLVGSCGSLYAVQKLQSISGYWHMISLYDSREEWHRRVKVSVMILEYIQEIEDKLPEPLHICDVKMTHFGITDDLKKIKYLDIDSVHPKSIVNRLTGDGSHCKQHSDCDFFDCRSFCNQVTFKCQYGVANNNLQIVCERIFLGWMMSRKVLIPGLLLGPHSPEMLVDILESCANPAQEDGVPRATASRDLLKRLHILLKHMLLS